MSAVEASVSPASRRALARLRKSASSSSSDSASDSLEEEEELDPESDASVRPRRGVLRDLAGEGLPSRSSESSSEPSLLDASCMKASHSLVKPSLAFLTSFFLKLGAATAFPFPLPLATGVVFFNDAVREPGTGFVSMISSKLCLRGDLGLVVDPLVQVAARESGRFGVGARDDRGDPVGSRT